MVEAAMTFSALQQRRIFTWPDGIFRSHSPFVIDEGAKAFASLQATAQVEPRWITQGLKPLFAHWRETQIMDLLLTIRA